VGMGQRVSAVLLALAERISRDDTGWSPNLVFGREASVKEGPARGKGCSYKEEGGR
jgi:hypothetical protein